MPNHPSANGEGYIYLHRHIFEQHLDRYLKSNELIHHKNGDKQDNRLENLELTDRASHMKTHGIKAPKMLKDIRGRYTRKA